MKLKLLTLHMLTGLLASAQLVGTEQTVTKQLYTGDFTVNGDKDIVIFKIANKIPAWAGWVMGSTYEPTPLLVQLRQN